MKKIMKTERTIRNITRELRYRNSPGFIKFIKKMFKDALQEMMNAEFDNSMGYEKNDKISEKQTIEMEQLRRI